ncbi:MAG: shikimate kinase [Deltaproteobacteria bacterium]|nr:shikimate kinase [Deltaproteobacteria bacterium]
MKHLILTGFMGVGKTTLGKILADTLQRPFIDTDQRVEEQSGMTVENYIKRFGWEKFRRLEKLLLQQTLLQDSAVIATGGGAVTEEKNRSAMMRHGCVVWVETSPFLFLQRLRQMEGRPLVAEKTNQELLQLYRQREPFYKKCHFRVTNNDPTPKQVANSILDQYRSFHAS